MGSRSVQRQRGREIGFYTWHCACNPDRQHFFLLFFSIIFSLYLPLMSRVLCNCLDLFNRLTFHISTSTHRDDNSELFFFLSCPLGRGSRVYQASHSPQRSFLSKAATLSLYPWAFSSLTDANCKGPLSRGIHTG